MRAVAGPPEVSRNCLKCIQHQFEKGERRPLMLANRAIEAILRQNTSEGSPSRCATPSIRGSLDVVGPDPGIRPRGWPSGLFSLIAANWSLGFRPAGLSAT